MQRDALVRELQSIVGADGVIAQPSELVVYETDGLSVFKHPPDLVVFPRSTEEVVAVVKLLRRYGLPIIPRGAGTGLSGGALAERGGVLITTTRMKRILQVDIRNRCVLVEAGVVNIHITNAVKAWNYHYAPDPSSQVACTIGGNIAENSGGPHTLKYGVTTNHILGVEVVLPDGEVVWLGGKTEESVGYDLRGVFIGSEGTFGIVTKAWVKLTRNPQSYRTMRVSFASVDDAAQAVSDIIAAGIIPAAAEFVDHVALDALKEAFGLRLPEGTKALLVIELDGLEVALDRQAERVKEICRKNRAIEILLARNEQERAQLWFARKRAFGALGQKGVVDETAIMRVLVSRRTVPQLQVNDPRLAVLMRPSQCRSTQFVVGAQERMNRRRNPKALVGLVHHLKAFGQPLRDGMLGIQHPHREGDIKVHLAALVGRPVGSDVGLQKVAGADDAGILVPVLVVGDAVVNGEQPFAFIPQPPNHPLLLLVGDFLPKVVKGDGVVIPQSLAPPQLVGSRLGKLVPTDFGRIKDGEKGIPLKGMPARENGNSQRLRHLRALLSKRKRRAS